MDYLNSSGELAEVFPPGEFLRDELEARGWSAREFAGIVERPEQVISEILNGKKSITPETALEIGAALGTSADMWLNMQRMFDMDLARKSVRAESLPEIHSRGHLRERVTISELIKRGVVDSVASASEQAAVVCDLLGIASIEDPLPCAARRSEREGPAEARQKGWLAAVKHRLRQSSYSGLPAYDREELVRLAVEFTRRFRDPASLSGVRDYFGQAGVLVVYESAFPGGKIDGATFFEGEYPVVAVSGRIGAYDSVVFTLLHEIAHVFRADVTPESGFLIDEESFTSAREAETDALAGSWMLPGWSVPKRPWSAARIRESAAAVGVHPSLVSGRLKKEHDLPWSHLNALHVRNIRPYLE